MAVVRMVHPVVLHPFQEAEPTKQQGWWRTLLQGVEDFFDVERVRNTLIIVVVVVAFLILAGRVLEFAGMAGGAPDPELPAEQT